MDEKMTCEEFQERLDGRTASDEELEELERHASACPDCAVLLAMNRHLRAETLSELEEQVPDSLVDTMWQRVVGEIAARRAERLSLTKRFWPFQRILVPAMAAAIVLLVFASGFLLGELKSLKQAVVANYATIVAATYQDALTGARELQTAVGEFLEGPSQEAMDAAREAWLNARVPYPQTEVYRFYGGPIEEVEVLVNAWPIDEHYIDYVEGDATAGIMMHRYPSGMSSGSWAITFLTMPAN